MKSIATLLSMLALLAMPVAHAADGAYREGSDYTLIGSFQAPSDPSRIVVEEFFWYGCPHCFAVEPAVERWLAHKPADVDFVRLPNSLGRPIGLLHSKAYYAAVLLGVLDKVHEPMFTAIHVEHRPLDTLPAVTAFLAEKAGLQPAAVEGALNSFMIDANVGRAEDQAHRYGLTGTPTLVVDGHYAVKATANPEDMLKVTDFLVALARNERTASPRDSHVAADSGRNSPRETNKTVGSTPAGPVNADAVPDPALSPPAPAAVPDADRSPSRVVPGALVALLILVALAVIISRRQK